jgi:hypothetical protein
MKKYSILVSALIFAAVMTSATAVESSETESRIIANANAVANTGDQTKIQHELNEYGLKEARCNEVNDKYPDCNDIHTGADILRDALNSEEG